MMKTQGMMVLVCAIAMMGLMCVPFAGAMQEHATPSVTKYLVTFSVDPVAGGTVTFNGTIRDDGDSESFAAGAYAIVANAATGYSFDSWNISYGWISEGTTAHVIAHTATFKVNFTLNPVITFNANPADKGEIKFDGTTYQDGDTLSIVAGTYDIKAYPDAGYDFVKWKASSAVNCDITDILDYSTTIVVTGACTLTVYVEKTPTTAPPTTTGESTVSIGGYAIPTNYLIVASILILLIIVAVALSWHPKHGRK